MKLVYAGPSDKFHVSLYIHLFLLGADRTVQYLILMFKTIHIICMLWFEKHLAPNFL